MNNTRLHERLMALNPNVLRGIRRGIEKESLRTRPDGSLARTPHPAALGSPLTHPRITTDFSEAQVEMVTGTHTSAETTLTELQHIHQQVCHALADAGDERLWVASMPCALPSDENIPIGVYGTSHIGRSKSIYRMGLAHRYGRRMQTISGIHYNWSLPGLGTEEYFALIRNFRRHAFVLLLLTGASPAVCSCFVQGREHGLQPLGECMHLPWATSLRMGRLGYQSEAQSTLRISYNSLEEYAATQYEALTRPWPAYENIGLRSLGGDYNQLSCTLLQIENEFYSTIRPKRVIRPGERPLHALRERGVEYVEVRLIDLNPFVDIGIDADTVRLIDLFLLHCLLSDSPPDTPQEIEEINTNQQQTATRGREPGLTLRRSGRDVSLVDWAAEILRECAPIAQALDDALDEDEDAQDYARTLAAAQERLAHPERLLSARVLDAVRQTGGSYHRFISARSQQAHEHLLALPWNEAQRQHAARAARASYERQKQLEAADAGTSFEDWLRDYISPARLHL